MTQARSEYPGTRQKGPAWGSGAGGAGRILQDPAAVRRGNPLSRAQPAPGVRPLAGVPSPFRCPRGGVEEPPAQVTSVPVQRCQGAHLESILALGDLHPG